MFLGYDWVCPRNTGSLNKCNTDNKCIKNPKHQISVFKFTLVANITGDVSNSRNINAKETYKMCKHYQILIWNINKSENYGTTQLPLESDLSQSLHIQIWICSMPAYEIFESRILVMVCSRDLVHSLYMNLNGGLKCFQKNKIKIKLN